MGCWVDVKDTINQWLEAQVTDLRGDEVFVHYNGWASRWDEWIHRDSKRIALFRTHTVQNPKSLYLSAFPNTPPENLRSLTFDQNTLQDVLS